jgi:hypothetical protein
MFSGVHRDSPILFASFFRPLPHQCIDKQIVKLKTKENHVYQ